MKQIILIIGECHTDPAPTTILTQIVNELIKKDIPQVFCSEGGLSNDVKKQKCSIKHEIESVHYLMAISGFVPESKINHCARLSFSTEQINQARVLSRPEIGQYMERYLVNTESLKLYSALEAANIPFFGIDDANASDELLKSKLISKALELENTRIKSMTDTIIKASTSKLPEGGVILVQVGLAHAHRLSVHLKLSQKKERLDPSCEIHVVGLSSVYSTNVLAPYRRHTFFEKQFGIDSPEIHAEYSTIPFPLWNPIEKSDLSFECPELKELLRDKIIGEQFYIPNWNIDKKTMVQNLGGTVLQLQGSGATIRIPPPKLEKAMRDSLEITSTRLNFISNAIERIDFLRQNIPLVTIIAEKNKFVVTYPTLPKYNQLIESLIDDVQWERMKHQNNLQKRHIKIALVSLMLSAVGSSFWLIAAMYNTIVEQNMNSEEDYPNSPATRPY